MKLPPVIRIFFAIDLSPTLKEQLARFIHTLSQHQDLISSAIHWTSTENLHITLQFLPKVHTEQLPLLIDNISAKLANIEQLKDIQIGKLLLFPNAEHPRVIALHVFPQTELTQLAQLIRQSIQALGYPVETRPFHAHLTLGRIKNKQNMSFDFLNALKVPVLEKLIIKEVVLFRSEPQPDQSVYTPLQRILLGVF
jgi:2'-5' RNA ligase